MKSQYGLCPSTMNQGFSSTHGGKHHDHDLATTIYKMTVSLLYSPKLQDQMYIHGQAQRSESAICAIPQGNLTQSYSSNACSLPSNQSRNQEIQINSGQNCFWEPGSSELVLTSLSVGKIPASNCETSHVSYDVEVKHRLRLKNFMHTQ